MQLQSIHWCYLVLTLTSNNEQPQQVLCVASIKSDEDLDPIWAFTTHPSHPSPKNLRPPLPLIRGTLAICPTGQSNRRHLKLMKQPEDCVAAIDQFIMVDLYPCPTLQRFNALVPSKTCACVSVLDQLPHDSQQLYSLHLEYLELEIAVSRVKISSPMVVFADHKLRCFPRLYFLNVGRCCISTQSYM